MFSNIDFLSGEVKWMDDYLQEDMLLVEYPNNVLLDLEFKPFYGDLWKTENIQID